MNAPQSFWLIPVAILLLLAGCDDSKHPLSDAAASKPDAQLAGVWKHQDDGGNVTYYHVGSIGGKIPDGLMRVVSITHFAQGKVEGPGEWLVFLTHLNGNTYLNVTGGQDIKALQEHGWQAEKAASYFLFKYRNEGSVVLLWRIDAEAKRRAIESRKIQGVIEKQHSGPDRVLLTDTTPNLGRLVAQEGDKLFSPKPLRFERVK